MNISGRNNSMCKSSMVKDYLEILKTSKRPYNWRGEREGYIHIRLEAGEIGAWLRCCLMLRPTARHKVCF